MIIIITTRCVDVTLSARDNNTSKSDVVELTEPKEEEWLNKSELSCSMILVNIPYSRKKNISTLLALSAAILMLLATTSPVLLSNFLQPVQAQTAMSFRTLTPASGTMTESPIEGENATLTFDVHGTQLVTPYKLDSNGAYQITSRQGGKILSSGPIHAVQGCCLTNDSSMGEPIHLLGDPIGAGLLISTYCSTLATNHIDVWRLGPGATDIGHFQGPVECSPQGGNTTQQSSSTSMTGTTTQDADGDGIPNANDNCPNLPNTRCYKEGDTTAVVVHNSNG